MIGEIHVQGRDGHEALALSRTLGDGYMFIVGHYYCGLALLHLGDAARWPEIAKLNGLDPEAYIAAVLDRLAHGHPITRLDELLPWNFKAQRQAV